METKIHYDHLNRLLEGKLDTRLCSLADHAWKRRQEVFGDVIAFFKPVRTAAISATGASCQLNCSHCGGHYLKSMYSLDAAISGFDKRGVLSCLVSGGCDKYGRVNLESCWEKVYALKDRYRINIHTGMPKDEDIKRLYAIADVISMDIPVSDKVIKEVYGLDYTVEHYIEVFRKLSEGLKVVPHICLGLDDETEAELSIIEKLKEIGLRNLCFIIFTPTRNTRFENRPPPEGRRVFEVLAKARVIMPQTEIALGCMRPGGVYRETVDSLALAAGVNGIVMPHLSAQEKAKELGLRPLWHEECCAFF